MNINRSKAVIFAVIMIIILLYLNISILFGEEPKIAEGQLNTKVWESQKKIHPQLKIESVIPANGSIWTGGSLKYENREPLPVPILLLPIDGSNHEGIQMVFNWQIVSGADNYWLQISKDSDFTELFFDEALGNATGVEIAALPDDGTHFYWRVKAGKGNSRWSSWALAWKFQNGIEIPPCSVELLAPCNGALIKDTRVTLSWQKMERAALYMLQIAIDNSFTQIVYEQAYRQVTGITLQGLPAQGKDLYWRVRAGSGTDWGNWSYTQYFTIEEQE